MREMNKLKKVSRFLCSIVMLSVIFYSFCGFTVSAEVRHNGKGTATLVVESDLTLEDFRERLDAAIVGYNNASAKNTQVGGDDMLVVKEIGQTEAGYKLTIDFRRIDKLEINGKFEHTEIADYTENYISYPESGDEIEMVKYNNQTLVKWGQGNLTGTAVNTLGSTMQLRDRTDTSVKILPYTAAGEQCEIDDLIAYGKKAKDNVEIFTFYILGAEKIRSAQISFPGNITFYAGENVKLKNETTFEVSPFEKTAEYIGSDGKVSQERVGCLIGYVIYEKTMSIFEKLMIAIGCVAAVGTVGGICLYFHATGKKILEKEKEGENTNG